VPSDTIRVSPIRTLAVAATDNGLLAPERAVGIRREEREVESASAIIAVLLGRALRRCAFASRTYGRCSGESRRRRSPHGTRMRRSCRGSDGAHSACDLRQASAARAFAA